MAYIYKITNLVNGKSYIGKTEKQNPQLRFDEHLSNRNKYPERPLYRAMNKYGIANFTFEIIEQTLKPEEREIFWIQYYDTYGHSGYNATIGGDGKSYFDYVKILEDYQISGNMSEVARLHGCHVSTVKRILTSQNIVTNTSEEVRVLIGKKVGRYNKITLELIDTFDTQKEAARFLITNKFSNVSSPSLLAAKISLVCRGKRKTCAGFIWKYSE